MASRTLLRLVPALLLVACSGPQTEQAPPSSTGGGIGAAPQAAAPAPTEPAADAAAPAYPGAGTAAVPAAAAPAATVLVSQETNWPGVVAELIEFRRKGNTLTAKVRLRNGGTEKPRVEVKFDEVYLMDAANARKVEVLKDEKGTYIAALSSNWADRWYDTMEPAQSHLLWMKFPAPPLEVKTISLHLPNTPPFDDVPIQDS